MDESLWPPAFERLRARGKSAGWAFPQVNPGAGEVPQWVREKEERDGNVCPGKVFGSPGAHPVFG